RIRIRNTDRVVGTILGSEITRRFGAEGLPDDTAVLRLKGSAGQSFGAFVPRGVTLVLEGEANDYFGKGLSGGKLVVYPPADAGFVPEENIITGNVNLYGATGGEAYIRGIAGERFCVRNSGAQAVVEGIGDHGCEYMTGGRVVILGRTGSNFGAGMSGGIAYVLDADGHFGERVNREMVEVGTLEDPVEIGEVRSMIERHVGYTGSTVGRSLLESWEKSVPRFVKVLPTDYRRMLESIAQATRSGLDGEEAIMAAFEANLADLSRASGN
ncbi:MAG: glutamate synthase subunit alpha, partial [Clostridia bacterium]|nr:glutamate synthase subunit alpha [Clostridia bacterium]